MSVCKTLPDRRLQPDLVQGILKEGKAMELDGTRDAPSTEEPRPSQAQLEAQLERMVGDIMFPVMNKINGKARSFLKE